MGEEGESDEICGVEDERIVVCSLWEILVERKRGEGVGITSQLMLNRCDGLGRPKMLVPLTDLSLNPCVRARANW